MGLQPLTGIFCSSKAMRLLLVVPDHLPPPVSAAISSL